MQQTSRLAANKQSFLAENETRACFDERIHLYSDHMSSQQVKRGEYLHSEASDASADGGLGCVQS